MVRRSKWARLARLDKRFEIIVASFENTLAHDSNKLEVGEKFAPPASWRISKTFISYKPVTEIRQTCCVHADIGNSSVTCWPTYSVTRCSKLYYIMCTDVT